MRGGWGVEGKAEEFGSGEEESYNWMTGANHCPGNISPSRAIGQRYPPYSTFDHNLSLQGRAARKIHPAPGAYSLQFVANSI